MKDFKNLFLKDLDCLQKRPGKHFREEWLHAAIVDYTVKFTVQQLPEEFRKDITVLPASFDPLTYQDLEKRELKPIVFYPMCRHGHFCLMIYSRVEETVLLLGMLFSYFSDMNEN